MKLVWLGKYRDLVEKIIKYGNCYAQDYNREWNYGTCCEFSASQLQVMEYILENEEKNQNMAEVAARLGISPSAFSKNVKKMVEKGLLEKFHPSNNRKNVIIRVSEQGREVYRQYSDFMYRTAFKPLFDILDEIPTEYVDKFTQMMDLAGRPSQPAKEAPKIDLIKIP